jgi:hypothetical protein
MASKTEKLVKAQETHLGNLLTQYMYAVIDDHNNTSDRLDKYKSALYQTYVNLMRKKDDPDKIEGAEGRFSVQIEVKQHLAYIFRSVCVEISKVEIAKDSNTLAIIKALTDEFQDDSIAAPYLQLGVSFAHVFGSTLKNSTDESNWIHAQTIGMLPGLKTNLHLVAEIATAVDLSLRAVAWFLGRGVWFGAEKSISSEVFVCAVAQPTPCMFSLNILDTLSKEVRAKPPRVKAPKSKEGSATVQDNIAVGTVSAPENLIPSGTIGADIAKVLEGL